MSLGFALVVVVAVVAFAVRAESFELTPSASGAAKGVVSTTSIGPLTFGASRARVRASAGNPEFTSPRSPEEKVEGKPEHVVNFMLFVAEEARELMAKLGVRSVADLIGRADLLDTRAGMEHWKAKGLDFSRIFHLPQVPAEVKKHHCETQDHGLDKALDNRLIELARPALERREKVTIETPIRNINRTVGTMLSGEIAKRYGHEGLPDETVHVRLAGSAGQSFGAFLARGVWLDLIGDTNDYCGKGLSGGRIAVQPSPKFRGEPTENIITGNVALYGAIEGEAYFRGVAGERFAVRNSGAQAVVEGLGDHGCEYMTGGTIVVLGATGRNFAAGMSGGIAYVLDERGDFARYCNLAMVALEPLLAESEQEAKLARELWHLGQSDEATAKRLIERHARYTGSAQAKRILERWSELSRASSSRCSRTSTGARSASLPPSTSGCAA